MTGELPGMDRLNIRMSEKPVHASVEKEPGQDLRDVVALQLKARNDAIFSALSLHGVVGTLDIFNTARNLAGTTNIISYRVPSGQLAVVTHFAFVCNNPVITMANQVVWRLLVNGQELPNMNTTLQFGLTGYRTNVGNPHRPMAITPFVAQPDQLIALELRPSALIAGNYGVYVARLVGRLVNPGTTNAVMPGGF